MTIEPEDTQTLLKHIAKVSNATDVYEVHRYAAYRERPDGALKEVTIEVLDGGPEAELRYLVRATDEDDRGTSGNPHDQLDVALSLVHWHDLDCD